MSIELSNSITDKVFGFIEYTNQSIFLTGKAGTGKTTLLKRIKSNSSKKMVIVAPTGVAAMNAKGTTINSFFQLPPGSFFPGDVSLQNLQAGFSAIKNIVADLSYGKDKLKIFNELELLIIDEVSMVRCDVLDMLDAILRSVRNNNYPFGGLQLLLIGDLYQLPPVTKQEDWTFLNRVYPSPYFFDSLVIRQHPLIQIELTTVFRQTEEVFINILNDIRNNRIDEDGLTVLNKRYDATFKDNNNLSPIIITSHNAEANAINTAKLDEIEGEAYTMNAEISGEFKEMGLQAEQQLKLKVGAQVMFIKNDTGENRRFYNGKIGQISSITNGQIYVSFPEEEALLLEKSSWQSFEYKLDEEEVISQQQVGEFLQYPVKLAWAVTIHKSQGLTFETAIIDAGKSFIAGQVYVALSRVRTLNGLILKSKIKKDSLRSNPAVIAYMQPSKLEKLTELMINAQEEFILQLIFDHFSLSSISNEIDLIENDPEIIKANLGFFKAQLKELQNAVLTLISLKEKFQVQVKKLHQQNRFEVQHSIQERIESAAIYFEKELSLKLLNPILKMIRIKPKNKIEQQVQHQLQKLRQHIANRITLIHIGTGLLKEPIKVDDYQQWIIKHRKQRMIKQNNSPKTQQAVTLQLF
jgi:ATP-dependent DNA helicase PIF1